MQGAMQGVAATIRKVPAHSQWGLLISVQACSFTHKLCPVAAICNFKTQPVPRQCPTCLVLSFLSLSRSLFPTKHTPTHLQQSTLSTTTKPAHRSISAQRLLPAPGSPVDLPLLFILYTISFQPYIHTLALLCLSIFKRCLLHKGLISTPASQNHKKNRPFWIFAGCLTLPRGYQISILFCSEILATARCATKRTFTRRGITLIILSSV